MRSQQMTNGAAHVTGTIRSMIAVLAAGGGGVSRTGCRPDGDARW
jgi:hypothetical protein